MLCDLDGTLVDSSAGVIAALRSVCAQLGQPLDPVGDYGWCVGPPLEPTFAQLLPNGASVPRAVDLFRTTYRPLAAPMTRPMPGVGSALASFRRDARRLAVVTFKIRSLAEVVLAATGLARYFDVVVGPRPESDGRATKAALITEALFRLDHARADARPIMIGDHDEDARGARTAEVDFVRFGGDIGWHEVRRVVEQGPDAPPPWG